MNPVQIHFVDTHRWRSLAVFNPNAFSPSVRAVVDASGARLALALYHTGGIGPALERASSDFQRMLRDHGADLGQGIQQRPDLSLVVVYDGVGMISEIHNALNATKSFLDLYAKLIGKLINERNEFSFGKATIDGRKLAGGRFINALRRSSDDGTHSQIADAVHHHSTEWITEAVTYRDQLSHRSDLNRMVPLFLPLHRDPPHARAEAMGTPRMPNGVPVLEYFEGLQERLLEYVVDSIRLAPNVDQSLISPAGLRNPYPKAGNG